LAKQLYPGGIEIGGAVNDLDETLKRTQEALKLRQPLFEAAFEASGGYARVDILKPAAGDTWDLIEVKSTTRVKDLHLLDLAFQAWLLVGAGVRVRKCFLMHINRDFVRRGRIDPKEFFVQVDLSQQVAQLTQQVENTLGEFSRVIQRHEHPDVAIGPHCDDPYTCPLHDRCWAHLPENNVLTLYRGTKQGFALLQRGMNALQDIPDSVALTQNQEIQRRVAQTGQPYVDRAALSAFLGELKYPACFLDFETFGTAIPLFDGVRPYQQIPFQFSLHIVRSPGTEPEHHRFLAAEPSDPRPEFLRQLRQLLPGQGSIVIYNAGFERSRLQECCEVLPEHRDWCSLLDARIIDLLQPFRNFSCYHSAQHGSCSMKAVLPALTGIGYRHLVIQEGDTASREFLRVTFGAVPNGERQRVRDQLEEYCGLDTLGMLHIIEELERLAGPLEN
jgi:CRISPR/Cas system-associated exonuclease Cas4 (RecB family)